MSFRIAGCKKGGSGRGNFSRRSPSGPSAPPPQRQLCGRGRWLKAEQAGLLGRDDDCFNISCSPCVSHSLPSHLIPLNSGGHQTAFPGELNGLEAGENVEGWIFSSLLYPSFGEGVSREGNLKWEY